VDNGSTADTEAGVWQFASSVPIVLQLVQKPVVVPFAGVVNKVVALPAS
jgi:hypothetical protein